MSDQRHRDSDVGDHHPLEREESTVSSASDIISSSDSGSSTSIPQISSSHQVTPSAVGSGTGNSGGQGGRNGHSKRLVHSVSIVVEPVAGDGDSHGPLGGGPTLSAPSVPMASTERRNTIAGPIVILEDFDPPRKAVRSQDDELVQSLIASARLRKEEFARLLEEHAQLVNEINRAETSLL